MIETIKLLNQQSYSRKHVGSILKNVRSKFASSKNESEWKEVIISTLRGRQGIPWGNEGEEGGGGGVHLWVKTA